jgi:hypothetical protein
MPGGIGSTADNGCNCHGGAQSIPNDSLNISFTGLPAIYTGNTTYELTIELHLYNLENENRNGYRVSAEHGTFTVKDSNSHIMDAGATQTSTGMEQTVWTMYWTAPEPIHNITFRAHAFWGDGGNGDSTGDSWVTTSFTTLPIDSDSDGVPDGTDIFPEDANETLDTDQDGVGDNEDQFPLDESETVDSDGDGVGDNEDIEPGNPDIDGPEDVYYLEKNDAMILGTLLVIVFAVSLILTRRREPSLREDVTESESSLFE